MFNTIAKMIDFGYILNKLVVVFLNQGASGAGQLLELLEELSGSHKDSLLGACLKYPSISKNVLVPLLLEDLSSRRATIKRKNWAAGCLGRLGVLLDD